MEVDKMFDVIFKPVESIMAAKKDKSMSKTMVTLIVAAIIGAVGALISTLGTGADAGTLVLTLLVSAVVVFVAELFLAWLYQIFLVVMGKKTKYYSTLTALAKGLLITATFGLVAALVNLIPTVGVIFGALVIAIGFVLGSAVILKTVMELENVDLLTALVGLLLVYAALIVAIYTAVLQMIMSQFGSFSGPSTLPMY